MRLGQKNGIVRQWARTGTRPRQPKDQRYRSAYLFGAVCPARGTGAAVAMPFANTHAMQAHLEEIGRTVAAGSHAVLLMDRAGWHTTGELKIPDNITLLFLPPRSPELNPAENVWQYLRQTYLSNRVFDSYEDIIDAAGACPRESGGRLEQAHRKAMENHVNRYAQMGTRRSISMTAGITPSCRIVFPQ